MSLHRITYDVDKVREDMALRGWLGKDLARAAGVSEMTVSTFLREKQQTAKTAAKLAGALGYSIRRYLRRAA